MPRYPSNWKLDLIQIRVIFCPSSSRSGILEGIPHSLSTPFDLRVTSHNETFLPLVDEQWQNLSPSRFRHLCKNVPNSSRTCAVKELTCSNHARSLGMVMEFPFLYKSPYPTPRHESRLTLPEAELSPQEPARCGALLAARQPERSAAEDANGNGNAPGGQRYVCSASVNDTVQSQDCDNTGLRGLCTVWLCGYSPANRSVD